MTTNDRMSTRDRWLAFWKRTRASSDPLPVHATYKMIECGYAQPHRTYHVLQHIDECLAEFEAVRHLAVHPNRVEMALWFHDIVYDTRSKRNEEESGLLAEFCAVALMQQSVEFATQVYSLVLATKHNAAPVGIDAKLVMDCDLTILGKPRKEFDTYERGIRKEYEWVPEDQFKAARRNILEQFLARPKIYFTGHFQQKYELSARVNLERSLTRLR